MSYGQRAMLALDQFVGALIPGGSLDMTISTRAGLNKHRWQWRWLYLALDTCFPRHCERARTHDMERARAMEHYLEREGTHDR